MSEIFKAIVVVVDSERNPLVEYNYDPWGKITCTYLGEGEGEDQATLQMATAILCPLTYRGYNYDFTTGLYYLQSRYYNPEWGRFLNCDDTSILLATQGETHGANMFAYCGNNPVNDIDPSGMRSSLKKGQSFPAWVGNLIGVIFTMYPIMKTDDDIYKYVTYKRVDNKKFLYYISINLTKSEFYSRCCLCISINDELTYQFLTFLARYAFEEKEKRYFLFSDDCMTDEIRFHFEAYQSYAEYQFGVNNGILTPTLIDFLTFQFLKRHCESIELSEGDVYDSTQAKAFNYNEGIRSCYKNTQADPYWLSKSSRSSKAKVPADRTDWERWLKQYGKIS